MDKIKSIELEEPKLGARSIPVLIGALLAIAGIIMCFTVILILPGLGAFLVGLLIVYAGVASVISECPRCDTEIKVRMFNKGIECEGCGTKSPVKWNKRKANKWTSGSARKGDAK